MKMQPAIRQHLIIPEPSLFEELTFLAKLLDQLVIAPIGIR